MQLPGYFLIKMLNLKILHFELYHFNLKPSILKTIVGD
jgi:hypothetical protein